MIFYSVPYAQTDNENSGLMFLSDNDELNQAFNWAKEKALSYAHSDDPVGKWYEAALPERDAFCMRDVSHQSIGAAILGLTEHNKNMFRKFAENISESKDWCSYWEINKFNRPAPVDYRNDKDFWYNLPANFDLIDACFRQYMWTDDTSFIRDPVFLNFYEKSLYDYVERWQLNPTDILLRDRLINLEEPKVRSNSFYYDKRGIPGYNEGGKGIMKLGIDLTASQIAAYKAYLKILERNGNTDSIESLQMKLKELKEFSDKLWWDADKKAFKTILYEDGSFDYAEVGNNQAFSHYLLYFRTLDDPEKIKSVVNSYLINKDKIIVELASHVASVFFLYGAEKEAGELIISLASKENKRRDYPENSFAIVEDIVTGLMGIRPDTRSRSIITLSNLYEGVNEAEIRNLQIKGMTIDLKHFSNHKTGLTNRSDKTLTWTVMFKGRHKYISINKKKHKARIYEDKSKQMTYSILKLELKSGERALAEI
jgi:hypothetical protein